MDYQDFVFPIIIGENENGTLKPIKNYGTGFLIGRQGFALTAKHIFLQIEQEIKKNQQAYALFYGAKGWEGVQITSHEVNEQEDIAIFQVPGVPYDSIFEIHTELVTASMEYSSLGYPHSVAEQVKHIASGLKPTPDLVYSCGYIRRRFTHEMPAVQFQGTHFFEVSEVLAEGYSGSPVYLKQQPKALIGVYLGIAGATNAGYAVRADFFSYWTPKLLHGKNILEETNNI